MLLTEAEINIKDEKYEDALNVLQRAKETSKDYFMLMMTAQYLKGDEEKTYQILMDAAKAYPSSYEVTARAGAFAVCMERYFAGRNLLNTAFMIEPENPFAIYYMGLSYYNEGYYQKAAKWFSLVKDGKNADTDIMENIDVYISELKKGGYM